MTYQALKELLTESQLFETYEVHAIARTVGTYTLGNAIIACGVLNIELTGNDIDILIASTIN